MDTRRDVAVVLSGGGINGVLLELGFLWRTPLLGLNDYIAAPDDRGAPRSAEGQP